MPHPKLIELTELGQSLWFDYIQRSLIENGQLQALIDKGIKGVTSNPSIFEKAISKSSDYDDALLGLLSKSVTAQQAYEVLVLEDIGAAADLFLPVYKKSRGIDGYVSLEVSPHLAEHTADTIQEAIRLYQALDRPNIMIKVPATSEGIPAVKALIRAGININITLMFNMNHYRDVVEAYLAGLELRQQDGNDIDKIASVASFFISRVDSIVDQELLDHGRKDLMGKTAIANAKLVYSEFQNLFSGHRWEKLSQAGAKVQRPLWASTGTKNPEFPDTLYLDTLIGEHTVNTVPPATLDAFLDHGSVRQSVTVDFQGALEHLKILESLDISLNDLTNQLQLDGVASFKKAYDQLLQAIEQKLKLIND